MGAEGQRSRIVEPLARFANRPAAIGLAALWGLGEAIVVPVVPDVLLYLLAIAAPRTGLRLFLAALAGAVVGTLVLYGLALASIGAAEAVVVAVPGIDAPMLAAAATALAGGDPLALAQFGPGTPLKVYTVAWASGVGSLGGLLLGAVLNRVTRILPGLLVAMAAGFAAPGLLRRLEVPGLVVYTLGWVVVYVLYFAGPLRP